MNQGQKLTFPFSRDGNALATHSQDSLQDVTQNVFILTRTRRGSRPLAPELGFPDPTFVADVDRTEIVARLKEWEQRAAVSVDVEYSADGSQATRTLNVGLADDYSQEA